MRCPSHVRVASPLGIDQIKEGRVQVVVHAELDELDRWASEKYLLLTTFRKDGRRVSTPVWVARDGVELVVRTFAEAGKVKRIRRDGTVTLAPCDVRGRTRGNSVTGRARLLDADRTPRVCAAIERKYGIRTRLVTLITRLRYGSSGVVGIAITLEETKELP